MRGVDMKKIFNPKFFIFYFSFFVLALAGCGAFWVNPYITVEEDHLNWVQIHYYNTKRTPIRRVSVSINGAGHVEIQKGTSERVSNDFAKKYEDANWEHMEHSSVSVSPKHVNEIFQNLVNHGVLDTEKFGKKSSKTAFDRFIAVRANINNRTYSQHENIFEADPDLAEVLLDVIHEFNPPVRVR